MAVSKATVFEDQDKELGLFAKGLAHPARIAILRYLADKESCICGGHRRGIALVPVHRFPAPERAQAMRPH